MAQLEGFLESVFLAIKLNRTLCIPPFYKHKTDELNEAVSSELRLDSAELANLMTICETHEIKDSPSSPLWTHLCEELIMKLARPYC